MIHGEREQGYMAMDTAWDGLEPPPRFLWDHWTLPRQEPVGFVVIQRRFLGVGVRGGSY